MSKKYSLNETDLLKIGKGALMAMGGAGTVYLMGVLPEIDFGAYTALAVAIISILLNAARKFLTGE